MATATRDARSDVLCWRYDKLIEAGYKPLLAAKIAEDLTIDLHLACKLLKKGASQVLAMKILL
jgi:hypothetical protein